RPRDTRYSTLSLHDALPIFKMERLLETYYAFSPKGLRSFLTAIPVWLKEKMFLKRMLYTELEAIEKFDKKKVKLLFPEHHLSHRSEEHTSELQSRENLVCRL